jgi:hypothetical protein
MVPKIADALLFFAPERWGEVQKFSNLCSGTYQFDERTRRALGGVGQHYDKALIFRRLADTLAPGLRQDREHLDTHGFTPAKRSSEVAAVFEAAILELYSCIDCAAKLLWAIYGTRTRGFKKSTRSLFLELDNMTGDFPEPLRDAIRGGAAWFPRLLFLRDELTHLGAGRCDLPNGADKPRYMHVGVREAGKVLEIEDALVCLDGQMSAVNLFLGQVFAYLRSTLSNRPVHVMCGMVQGRMLMRMVDPTTPLDFGSGTCNVVDLVRELRRADLPVRGEMRRLRAHAGRRRGRRGTARTVAVQVTARNEEWPPAAPA